MEKADILEMAVKHLQNVQRQQLAIAVASDPSVLRKFKSGFTECANEIDRYVGQSDGVEPELKNRMKSHLQKCIGGIEQVSNFNFPGLSNLAFVTPNVFANAVQNEPSSGDQNNNGRLPQSIQLIPSRLPSGEIALLLPNSSNLPFLPQVTQQRERTSAFATVIPSAASSCEKLRISNKSPLEERGFRPVQPSKATYHHLGEPQVPQVSSTSLLPQANIELKTIKYPIHNYQEREKKIVSPKKIIEPLCIITNYSERYKQAQTREDSIDFEENRPGNQGVKRKFYDESQGLLSLARPETYQVPKMRKVESTASTSKDDEAGPSGAKDCGHDSDMWRPW